VFKRLFGETDWVLVLTWLIFVVIFGLGVSVLVANV